jgi:hypothetical protein
VTLCRFLILSLALIAILVLGVVVPRVLIPEERGDWQGEQAMAAIYAHNRMAGIGGPMQRLPRIQMTVVDVKPDPTGCDWGYRYPASGIVTIQAYTIFGLPWDKWVMGCNFEHLLR